MNEILSTASAIDVSVAVGWRNTGPQSGLRVGRWGRVWAAPGGDAHGEALHDHAASVLHAVQLRQLPKDPVVRLGGAMAEEEWGARLQMRVEEPDQPGEILLDRGLGGPAGSNRSAVQALAWRRSTGPEPGRVGAAAQ